MNPSDRIRILLVDDHPVVRDGLRGQLQGQPDLVVVGEAASAEEALIALASFPVDVVVADLRMPGGSGTDLIREIRSTHHGVEVLVLTTFDTDAEVTAALAAGARGFLLKDAGREAVFSGIRRTARGQTSLAPSVSDRVIGAAAADVEPLLTTREVEVLRHVADGRTNRQIGSALFIGESTVKTHLQNIFAKLETPDRAAAVAAAYRHRLL